MSERKRARVKRAVLVAAAVVAGLALFPSASQAAPCDPPISNPIACENSKPGYDPAIWQINGVGDPSIQGFATSMSVNVGQTINFKIKTNASNYRIDILRLGYYDGDGARLIASNIPKSASLPQSQPACLTNSSTGLIDCGNWGVSASWTVPSTAVSGVYLAHLLRTDTGGDSHIIFVVRNDASTSPILLQTSDATWQAYNAYGGNSLYSCTVACPPGDPEGYKAAYAVSYNRPFDGALSTDNGQSWFFHAEYQMVRWLERNGYNLSYTSSADVERAGPLLQNHNVFISSGHDEYWSAGQRSNVEAARDAGVNLAFFTGNEVFWKTRWTSSSDGSNSPYRTLVSYKETHFPSPVDPAGPATWTGTWRDPRWSPPGDGGDPENSLTGQLFLVNRGTSDIKVPANYGKLRLWRNTAAASLTSGQTLTLGAGQGTLGYEWDSDIDNGFRPPGLFRLSSTTVNGVEKFYDYGTYLETATATHNLTMYRAASGARVFGAGTVQWSWGLDNTDAWNATLTVPAGLPPDPNMEQATVNLFADMGVQPSTLRSGLAAAAPSSDAAAPSTLISAPSSGATLTDGAQVTISGTASDPGGGKVAGVEVSTDGGSTWHPATGVTPGASTSWSYAWVAHGAPTANIRARAVDDSGNLETASSGLTVNVSCPCSIWGQGVTPDTPDSGDGNAIEVGVKFKSDVFGTVTGVRFYKSAANTGTHVGSLWTASGQQLASATFQNETGSGWQTVQFSSPVAIQPNTTYVVSYHAPNGRYAASGYNLFKPAPEGGNLLDSPPLHVIPATGQTGNGVYKYSGTSTFPNESYQGSNYWVDVRFSPASAPGQVTNVSATAGHASAMVSWTAPATGGPPESYTVTPYIGDVAQTPTTVTGSPLETSVRVGGLTPGTAYTFRVRANNPSGSGALSAASNPVTPTAITAPDAPTNVAASPASSSAQVTWSAPSDDGGSAITGYTITPYIGAAAQTPVNVGATPTSKKVTGLTNGTAYTFKVSATNAIGTGAASAASNAVTPNMTLLELGTPAVVDSGDTSAVELGVKFRSDTFGVVNGIRFYKAAANTGTHVGSLWSATGVRLAFATFTNETASGWQEVQFSNPVPIQANTTYVASYRAPNGRYSATSSGFASAIDNPPLHGLANSASPNGVYAYGGSTTFPANSWNATNYWVDVLFAVAPAPGQVTGVQATAGTGSATVSWNAPSSGGPVTSYTVTPYLGGSPQAATTVTGSPPATNVKVNGLTGGQSYTFVVRASNPNGQGAASAASNAVVPSAGATPEAPTGVTAAAATAKARVSWTEPAEDNGSAVTGYTITPYIGAAAQTATTVGAGSTATTITGLTNGADYTFRVAATNANGTGAASAASNAVRPNNTLFELATPAVVDANDPNPVEIGVKLRSDVAGEVHGVRFYKAAANTGTHRVTLWNTSGGSVATALSSGETASGWQQVLFASPVTISANTTYIASYFASNGHYSATGSAFTPLGVDNAPLHALANGTSPNGVYAYASSSTFPTSSWNASNYWVDVLFDPAG
jgi:hypothetical protein